MIGALAFLIMKFEVPIIPGFDYLKMDFSDSLVALSTLVFGPLGGTMIALLSHYWVCSFLDLINFDGWSVSCISSKFSLYLAFYYISKKHEDKVRYQVLGLVVGTIALTIVMSLANYFV